MSATSDFLARQIGIVQAALKRPFSADPGINSNIVEGIARYLDAGGTKDIRDLTFYRDNAANLGFFFDIKSGHVYLNPITGDTQAYEYDPGVDHLLFYYQSPDDDYRIFATVSKDGFPIFYAVEKHRSSAWLDSVHAFLTLAGIAVAVAFPALGAVIGNAVLGAELAAAYPALASAVGNVALSTALNGGDVQAAVMSAVGAYAGGLTGAAAASATDSKIIGAVAASATRAAITGADIKTAVSQSFLVNGVKSADSLDLFGAKAPTGTRMDDSTTSYHDAVWSADPSNPGGGSLVFDAYPPPDLGPYVDPYSSMPATGYVDPYSNMPATSGGNVVVADPTAVPAGPSGVVASVGGADLTRLALAGLQAVVAWHAAGQPPLRASNSSVIANPNGTLTTRNPNGTVSTVQMPRGAPYLTTSGTLVTNNGNGTYSTVSPNGAVSTVPYAPGSFSSGFGSMFSGANSNALLIGGAALLALLLLSRR